MNKKYALIFLSFSCTFAMQKETPFSQLPKSEQEQIKALLQNHVTSKQEAQKVDQLKHQLKITDKRYNINIIELTKKGKLKYKGLLENATEFEQIIKTGNFVVDEQPIERFPQVKLIIGRKEKPTPQEYSGVEIPIHLMGKFMNEAITRY